MTTPKHQIPYAFLYAWGWNPARLWLSNMLVSSEACAGEALMA